MHTAVYALTRLILFGTGWGFAALMALAADFMIAGAKWPIFSIFAAWWTYVCAVYVQGEAANTEARNNAARHKSFP
jgi:polyferredoxin